MRITLKRLFHLIAFSAFFFVWSVDPQTRAQTMSPANEPYALSYAAGGRDAQGHFIGGTELMNLIDFQGKLYAGIGYWMDRPQEFAPSDPTVGAQILVMDSKGSRWRLEHDFTDEGPGGNAPRGRLNTLEAITFHRFDAAGNNQGPLAEMLVAGISGEGEGGVYTQRSPGVWEGTRLPTAVPMRSVAVHYDPVDRVEKIFAGIGGGQSREVERFLFSGVYDPSAPGRIRWNPAPERINLPNRVVSMVDCGGTLFAASKPSIFRRNDQTKTWQIFYTYPFPDLDRFTPKNSGFRALTCITGPDGKQSLLTDFEGYAGDVMRIDPQTGTAVTELRSRDLLTRLWGGEPARPDIVAGYNDIPVVRSGLRLLGLDTRSPNPAETNSGWFLSRRDGTPPQYAVHQVPAPTTWPASRSDTALWSVRSIAVSPFPEDQGQVLYMGGYDGHYRPVHNTAWIYRVGLDTALQPYTGAAR